MAHENKKIFENLFLGHVSGDGNKYAALSFCPGFIDLRVAADYLSVGISSTVTAVSTPQSHEVTQLLIQWGHGDEESLKALIPLVYEDLRRAARRYLRRERRDHTLQSAALVHEAYVRLIDQRNANWQNRSHFFGVASQLMRRILVDYARRRAAGRRGAGNTKLSISEDVAAPGKQDIDLLAIDDALNRLTKLDPQQSRIVELRFFSGLSIEDTAEVLRISPATVKRDWNMAKAWLYLEITGSPS